MSIASVWCRPSRGLRVCSALSNRAGISSVPTARSSPHLLAAPSSRVSSTIATSPSRSLHTTPAHHSTGNIITTDTTISEFIDRIEHTLMSIQDTLDAPIFEPANVDLAYSDGVLSIRIPSTGVWILSKHGATRQLWLSSPLSGPSKYNYHRTPNAWLNERDTSRALHALLTSEFEHALRDVVGAANSATAAGSLVQLPAF